MLHISTHGQRKRSTWLIFGIVFLGDTLVGFPVYLFLVGQSSSDNPIATWPANVMPALTGEPVRVDLVHLAFPQLLGNRKYCRNCWCLDILSLGTEYYWCKRLASNLNGNSQVLPPLFLNARASLWADWAFLICPRYNDQLRNNWIQAKFTFIAGTNVKQGSYNTIITSNQH